MSLGFYKDNKDRYWLHNFSVGGISQVLEHSYICLTIHMDYYDYIKYLCEEYNGQILEKNFGDYIKEIVYFTRRYDINRALEWIESRILINKIGG